MASNSNIKVKDKTVKNNHTLKRGGHSYPFLKGSKSINTLCFDFGGCDFFQMKAKTQFIPSLSRIAETAARCRDIFKNLVPMCFGTKNF